MKGKDSYPPACSGESLSGVNKICVQGESDSSKEISADSDEVRKRSDSDCQSSECENNLLGEDLNQKTDENPDSEESVDSEEVSEDSEDADKTEEWDGSEAEIVIDDESEEYEDENTGIKIKYRLNPDEIRKFVQSSEGYEKNKKAQKKHTIIQSVVFVLMVILSAITNNRYYLVLSAFPLVSLLLIWIIPYIGMRKIIGKVLKNQEFSVEIFPDKIDVTTKNFEKEIMLDGSCESEEIENMIEIFSDGELSLLIPTRAVEPEFRADLQAMILAGTKPRYKN